MANGNIGLEKDILFIDDKDDKNKKAATDEMLMGIEEEGETDEDFLNQYFSNGKECISLIKSFSEACDEIINNYNKYNLVIFDMNMEKGFTDINFDINKDVNDKENEENKAVVELQNKFKQYHIKFDIKNKYSGMYLYLLLQAKGYPSDRMIILTGNTDVKENFPYIDCTNIIKDKEDAKKEPIKIEEDYFNEENNSYYRIRRLVFQACEYWKEKLKNKYSGKDNDIPFNKLYKLEDDNAVKVDSFTEMLDDIKRLFPVLPDEPKKTYYQAAKTLCMFHENKAKITNIKGKKIFKYHQTAKFFRNWSSHHKFDNSDLDNETFALLFCIVLRTYFDKRQCNKKQPDKALLKAMAYEKCYYNPGLANWYQKSKACDVDKPNYEDHAKNEVNRYVLDFVTMFSVANDNSLKKRAAYVDLMRKFGENNSVGNSKYALYPLIFDNINFKIELDFNEKASSRRFTKKQHMVFKMNPKIYNANDPQFESECEINRTAINNNDIEGFFLRRAYNIIFNQK